MPTLIKQDIDKCQCGHPSSDHWWDMGSPDRNSCHGLKRSGENCKCDQYQPKSRGQALLDRHQPAIQRVVDMAKSLAQDCKKAKKK